MGLSCWNMDQRKEFIRERSSPHDTATDTIQYEVQKNSREKSANVTGKCSRH